MSFGRSEANLSCVCVQVRERDLPMVMHTLSSEFTLLRVVNGETVAANCSGVTNGFVKPKLGKFFMRHKSSFVAPVANLCIPE